MCARVCMCVRVHVCTLSWNKKKARLFLAGSGKAFSVCIFVLKREKQSTAKTLMLV